MFAVSTAKYDNQTFFSRVETKEGFNETTALPPGDHFGCVYECCFLPIFVRISRIRIAALSGGA